MLSSESVIPSKLDSRCWYVVAADGARLVCCGKGCGVDMLAAHRLDQQPLSHRTNTAMKNLLASQARSSDGSEVVRVKRSQHVLVIYRILSEALTGLWHYSCEIMRCKAMSQAKC